MAGNPVELATGYISLSVSTRSVGAQVARALQNASRAAGAAGDDAGASFSKGFNRVLSKTDLAGQVAAEVKAASQKVADARDVEAAASRKLRIEEAKLQELRASGRAKQSQLLAAEDRLASASKRLASAQSSVKTATQDLTETQDRANKELAQADASADKAGRAYGSLRDKIRSAFTGGRAKSTFAPLESEAKRSGDRAGKQLSGGILGATRKLAGPLAAAFAGVQIGGFLKDAVGNASDLEQSTGGVQAVFRQFSDEMLRVSDTASQSFGLSRNEFNSLATTLGAGLKNKGIQDFAGETERVIGLGADLAAQFGGSTKEAVEAVTSLMRGETDPIERYGVAINQTAINAELAANGQDKLKGKTLEQAKAQAALKLLFGQTADAQGAFARESDTLAGKQQRAAAAFENTKAKIGEVLLPVMTRLFGFISDKLLPAGERLGAFFRDRFGPIFARIGGVLRDQVGPAVRGFIDQFREGEGPGGKFRDVISRVTADARRLGAWFMDRAVPAIKEFIRQFKAGEGPGGAFRTVLRGVAFVVEKVYKWISDKAVPAVGRFIDKMNAGEGPAGDFKDVIDAVRKAIEWLVPKVVAIIGKIREWHRKFTEAKEKILEAKNRVVDGFEDLRIKVRDKVSAIGRTWDGIKERFLGPVRDVRDKFRELFGEDGSIRRIFSNAVSAIGRIWDGLREQTKTPIRFVVNTVLENGILAAFRKIAGIVGMDDLAGRMHVSLPPGFARGGILPGHSSWRDGDSVPVMARPGEGWTVSEALDSYERSRLLALNKWTLSGRSPDEFRERWQGFARGGLVTYKGGTFTERFAAAIQAAERLARASFSIFQGGFRPATSYSGTSHRGDALDVGPVNSRVVAALRQVGIAAWDRTGKGNWMPHIHGVPLPGVGTALGSAIWQAQDYLRGGDGLGGRDDGPRVGIIGKIGQFLKSGFSTVVDWLKNLLKDPLAKLSQITGSPFGRMISGLPSLVTEGMVNKVRGYATGTNYATPGLHLVGERDPELILSKQHRMFAGGERVMRLVASEQPSRQMLSGRLRIVDDNGLYGYVEGVVEAVTDSRDSRSILRGNLAGV